MTFFSSVRKSDGTMSSKNSFFVHVITVYPYTFVVPTGTSRRDVVPGSTSYIQSPNYPQNYPPNTEEHWVLTAPVGKRIVFIFKYMKTQRREDTLQVITDLCGLLSVWSADCVVC